MKLNKTENVRLGLMAPLSGIVKFYGTEISRAGRIACEEVNRNGGVLGNPLELIIVDDGSLPQTAVPAAEQLIEKEGCSAIIGNLLSNSRIAVANRVADRKKVPYLNFSFYEGSINSKYFFHFAALPNQQIDKMIPFMAEKYGPKMYFAGSNYEWPRGSIDAAKKSLLLLDGEIVGEEYLPIGSLEIDNMLERIAKSGADVLVPHFAGTDQVNLLTGFTKKGLKDRMAVVMCHYDEAMASNLSSEIREGFYSINTYFMTVNTPKNSEYKKELLSMSEVTGLWPKGNGILTNFGEGTYVCVKAFAKAANKAGSISPDALAGTLSNIRVRGPQGLVVMDPETRHAAVNTYLARCEANGSFTIIEEFGIISPVIPERYRNKSISELDQVHIGQERVRNVEQPNTLNVAILILDKEYTITYANNSFLSLWGFNDSSDIFDKTALTLWQSQDEFMEALEYVNQENVWTGKLTAKKSDKETMVFELTIEKIVKYNELAGYTLVCISLLNKISSHSDTTEKKKIDEKLIWKATHDPLTNLPNRTLFSDRLSNALVRTIRSDHEVALFYIDLDRFKFINDVYGHDIGDQILTNVGNKLVRFVRPGDTIARLDSDEFVVICEQITDRPIAFNMADRIIEALRLPINLADRTHYITGSIGLAFGHGKSHTGVDLLSNSDIAMTSAKDHGRDCWRIYDKDILEQTRHELEIANNLRTAIEKEEMKAMFQPIVDARTKKIVGAELLVRWFPGNVSISPGIFIPIAEKTGTISSIGYWVFEQACYTQVKLGKIINNSNIPYLSVNVSTRQLDEPMLVNRFASILKETGADPNKIILEITETRLMANVESNIRILMELADLGLKAVVDDFGTGYSSLSNLQKMPVSKLKIDKIFIDGLATQKESKAIVSAVINMSHALGLNVIAEGVETNEQLAVLQDLNCNSIQGFLFYKPLPIETFLEIVSKS